MALNIYYRHPRVYDWHFGLPPFGVWLKRNHDSILERLPAMERGEILEVGCSTGTLTRRLAATFPDSRILSIDRSRGMYEKAVALGVPGNVEYRCWDFWEMEGTFELIVAAGSWEFFELEPGLDKLEALLAPSGQVFINDVGRSLFGRCHRTLLSRALRTRMWLYNPGEFAAALERRGFECDWTIVNRLEGSYTLWAQRRR